jgi:hypothetical protein
MSRSAAMGVISLMHFRAMALAALGGTLLAPHSSSAQTSALVDEATFMVSRKGAPIGRESFRIIRAAGSGGQVYRAVATSALGELRMASTLGTDSLGAPVSYELRLTQRGEQIQFLQGRGRPDRFSVLVQTKGGEAGREYLVRRGTVLLDDELFHHFYFAALAGLTVSDSVIRVISPRAASDGQVRLEFRAIEPVLVGGQSLTGRKFALQDGNETRAEIWIDAAGRLLKVSVPGKALVALRDDPPR